MDKTEKLDINNIPKKKKRHLKKSVKLFLSLILVLVFILVFILTLYSYMLTGVSNTSKIVKFKVSAGASVYSIGDKLEKEGLIRSARSYKIYVKLNNVNDYKAGTYKLDKSYSTKKIVSILRGNTYNENGIKITFKEGITIRKVAKEIAKKTNITESEVYEKMEDKNYISSLIDKYWFLTDDIKNSNIYYPLEGYLYPETYVFNEDVTVEEIFKNMLDETDSKLSKYKEDINKSNYSINEIITLASVIEQEGMYDSDKKDIASVFYNRLNKNMPLGSDVTTYYAFKVELGERELTTNEINTYNPYNTRGPSMNGKIPVGAISNFSKSSLEAALYPNKTNYYYFVADKKGKTHFTKTYEEHQKVIKELKESGNWIEL